MFAKFNRASGAADIFEHDSNAGILSDKNQKSTLDLIVLPGLNCVHYWYLDSWPRVFKIKHSTRVKQCRIEKVAL